MLVDRGRRQQARNRRAVTIGVPVRQDDDRVAGGDGIAGALLQLLERARKTRAPARRIEDRRQRRRPERGQVHVAQPRELLVVDHRVVDRDLPAGFRPRVEQVAFGPDRRRHGRHHLLADCVERRVRDLRERLLEVVVEHVRPVRQHRERGVGPHGPDRLLAVQRHRRQQDAEVLVRVAEHPLPLRHGLVAGARKIGGRRQLVDVDGVAGDPVAIRMRARELALQLLVGHDAAARGVHEEDAPGLDAPLEDDLLGLQIQHTDFRRHHHQAVARDAIPRRTQAVPVEDGADHRPVREGDRRRAVPRLHQRRVVLVEGPQVRIHGGIARPRFRDHHQDRVRQRSAGHDEQLEHVVERRGVAAPLADDRQQFAQVVAEQRRLQQALAGLHPVDVAAQRVDLAVVRDEAIRMRERPRGEGVGAEPLVHEGQRGFDVGVVEIREGRLDLRGGEHALVDEGARRQARDVEPLSIGGGQLVDGVLDALPDDVQLAFERERIGGSRLAKRRRGRKIMPAPYEPASGRSMPTAAAALSRKRCGIWIRMPAPSPVLASQPQAPRCCRLISTWRPRAMTEWDRRPAMSTTNPTPHASCSNAGSYSPIRCAGSPSLEGTRQLWQTSRD